MAICIDCIMNWTMVVMQGPYAYDCSGSHGNKHDEVAHHPHYSCTQFPAQWFNHERTNPKNNLARRKGVLFCRFWRNKTNFYGVWNFFFNFLLLSLAVTWKQMRFQSNFDFLLSSIADQMHLVWPLGHKHQSQPAIHLDSHGKLLVPSNLCRKARTGTMITARNQNKRKRRRRRRI